ncbi:MAG: nucleotidyltransferase family protein [Pseudobdellovibrionaceae bacterium]|jgi:predicted nucleotidyltransferase
MIQLEDRHLIQLKKILSRYPFVFYIFGSRAKGTAKPLSDIDLLTKHKITKLQMSSLREELEESSLPMKVDIVVWDDISAEFQKRIANDLIEIK